MAENTYVNKVVFGNDTLLDLTEDSVTENTLLEGETAHKASGEPITGTAKQGHTIWNAIKTALSPQRLKLWFADAKVTDDSTEQATKVEVVQLIDDESELTNAPDGVYQGDYDDAPEGVLDASMVAYGEGSVEDALDELNRGSVSVTANGVKTYSVLLNELQALVNYSKISNNAFLLTETSGEYTIYRLSQYIESNSRLCFDRTRVYPSSTYKITTYTYILEPNNSHIYYAHFTTNYTFDNADASVPNSGTKFALYY